MWFCLALQSHVILIPCLSLLLHCHQESLFSLNMPRPFFFFFFAPLSFINGPGTSCGIILLFTHTTPVHINYNSCGWNDISPNSNQQEKEYSSCLNNMELGAGILDSPCSWKLHCWPLYPPLHILGFIGKKKSTYK